MSSEIMGRDLLSSAFEPIKSICYCGLIFADLVNLCLSCSISDFRWRAFKIECFFIQESPYTESTGVVSKKASLDPFSLTVRHGFFRMEIDQDG